MPELPLRLLNSAQCDLERIALLHRNYCGVESARNITNALLDRIEHLTRFPHMGFALPDNELQSRGYRGLVCDRRFLCVYRVIDGTLFVYRVIDTRSDYRCLFRALPLHDDSNEGDVA